MNRSQHFVYSLLLLDIINKYLVFFYLSMLMAHKLRIDAVHRSTSNEIQISHKIHPNCQEPKDTKEQNTI